MSGAAAPTPSVPLSVSWREWLRHGDWCDDGEPRAVCRAGFDAIVIGSGYGGSVAALRLAEKGYRVLVLERGSEYLPGEFPNDFSLVPKFARLNVPGEGLPIGRATGLIEVHLGQGMVGITGNGLGGGSLVNAGVLMQPDADVFAQPAWPATIRHARHGGLQPWFTRAREALGAQRWDATVPGGGVLRKTAALQRLGAQLGRAPQPVETTIDPAACLRCGDCASGCNRAAAKRSLDRSYLKRAVEQHHAQLVTQAEVYRFEPAQDPESGAHTGWRVHVFATDAQQGFEATAQVFTEPRPAGTARTLSAPMLFVCAGTFGSTQLLQRSQSLAGGRLAFSPALGTRVSGNGDSLSWLVNEPEPVGGVGQGARSASAWTFVHPDGGTAQAGPPDVRAMVGPTITAAIDLRRRADDDTREPRALPLEQRVVIEDAAIPRAIAQLSRELIATAGTLKQLGAWWFDRPRHPGAGEEDPLAASVGAGEHTQTLLAMGHDGSPARLVWLEGLDRSAPYLPQPELLATYQVQQQLFDRFGSRHVHNPLWQPMPAAALDLMSGEKPPRSVLTVHPLGGCVMGDDPASSVVDDRGRVWVHDPASGRIAADAIRPAGVRRDCAVPGEPHVYCGLHVLDGAIVPTSLGCNPLWTITALAERALAAVPDKAERPVPRPEARGAARAPEALASADVPVAARLNEVLQASEVTLGGELARCFGAAEAAGRLEASFATPDVLRTMQEGRHRLHAEARLFIGGREGPPVDGRRTPEDERLRYGGKDGEFWALPASAWSSGPWPFARSVLECAVLAVLALVDLWWLLHALGVPLPFKRVPPPDGALALAALFAFAALSILLRLPRTAITWLILRGGREIADAWREWRRTGRRPPLAFAAMFRQFVHAAEKRVMVYRIPMYLQAADPSVRDAPRRVTLHATKTVTYTASVGELLQWIGARLRAGRSPVPVRLRPTFWEQVMDAHVRVVAGEGGPLAPALLRGIFRMGFENLTSSGLASARRGARPPIALGLSGDTTSGVLALAAYPLVFLRFALKTRLLDFRLPSYSGVPLPDQAPPRETWLRLPHCSIAPDLHWLRVPRGGDGAAGDPTDPLDLQLWRYRQRDADGRPVAPCIVHGRWNGRPVARAKAVLLLHAFGQSGLTYTLKTIPRNLAERFHRAGYEVWVLEMRMSTRSGYAGEPCAIDQIARHDVAGAVGRIVRRIARETGASAPVQIAAFAQCIGSAALWMAALSGELRHEAEGSAPGDGDAPRLSMLSHAMFSQVHPWIVGDRGTQAKTWVPALLQALWRRGTVPFAVRGAQPGLFLPFLDRVLASMPAPAAEGRRYEGHEDAAATCRRIRFIEAPLFRHENLNDATFGAMNLLFGDANLRLFAHARRFVDRERLVDEDGVNRYVTDANIRRHLAFPVQLLHGEVNELFDVESALNSFQALQATHGAWQQAFCRTLHGKVGPIVVPGHGHLDVLIGRHAPRRVFPHIVRFFDACLAQADHVPADPGPPRGWAVRAPRVGPLPGWLREEGGRVLLRLAILVDERNDASLRGLPVIRVRFRAPGQQRWRTLQLPEDAWQAMPVEPSDPATSTPDAPDAPDAAAPRVAWADLPLEGSARLATRWQVLTLHESHAPVVPLLPSPHVDDAALDAYLARFPSGPNALGALVPPLTVGGHDFGFRGAFFRLPGVALSSLAPGRDLSFAIGSCRHPGLGLDRDRVDHAACRFVEAQGLAPVAFGMLLGDQIYADATAGLVDPRSPRERYLERHEQAFERAGLGRLLARMPFYMTPDDHEFIDGWPTAAPLAKEDWPDWSEGSAFEQRQRAVTKVAQQAVSAFQRLQSPLGGRCAPFYRFEHGCARFFVLDSRLGRRRERPQLVDPAVFAHLREWLQAPQARHSLNVLACGSVVMPALRINADPANPGPEDTWQYAPEQREELLALLAAEAPGRFLLLSGDYHVSGAGLLRDGGGRVLGAAVVAPPLYAPMPYANASPDMVGLDDADRGGTLRFSPVAGGAFLRGSGLGVLHVHRRKPGGFLVCYERSLWGWESGTAQPTVRARLLLP